MDEYIGRDAVCHAISVDRVLNAYEKAYCIDIVRKIPAADVARVWHGRWVKQDDYSCCSQCGQSISDGCVSWFKYCPSCGEKMEVGDKNDE